MPQKPAQRPQMREATPQEVAERKAEKYEQFVRDREKQRRDAQAFQPLEIPLDLYVLVEYTHKDRDTTPPFTMSIYDKYLSQWKNVTFGPTPPKKSPVKLLPWQAVMPLYAIEGRLQGQPFTWTVVRDISPAEFSGDESIDAVAAVPVAEPPKINADAAYVEPESAFPAQTLPAGDAELPSDLGNIEG